MAATREMFKHLEGKWHVSEEHLQAWDEYHWLSFMSFCKVFIDKETKKWTARTKLFNMIKDTSDPYWVEFLVRLGTDDFNQFKARFIGFRNRILKYMDRHPSCVTDKMREESVGYPTLTWATKPDMLLTEPKDGSPGEVVVITPTAQTPEESYQHALKKSLGLFHKVADNISEREIQDMDTSRKFDALRNLNQIFVAAKAYAPRSKVFLNFNIEKASVKDIEEKLLNYSEEQEEI